MFLTVGDVVPAVIVWAGWAVTTYLILLVAVGNDINAWLPWWQLPLMLAEAFSTSANPSLEAQASRKNQIMMAMVFPCSHLGLLINATSSRNITTVPS